MEQPAEGSGTRGAPGQKQEGRGCERKHAGDCSNGGLCGGREAESLDGGAEERQDGGDAHGGALVGM